MNLLSLNCNFGSISKLWINIHSRYSGTTFSWTATDNYAIIRNWYINGGLRGSWSSITAVSYTATSINGFYTYTAQFDDGITSTEDTVTFWKHNSYNENFGTISLTCTRGTGLVRAQGTTWYDTLYSDNDVYAYTQGSYGYQQRKFYEKVYLSEN